MHYAILHTASAYGLPIALVCTYTIILLLSRKALLRAFHTCRRNTYAINLGVFLLSICSSIASMLLYFSPAWKCAVASTAVWYTFAFVMGTSKEIGPRWIQLMFAAVGAWALVAIRTVPVELSHSNCVSFYGIEAESMCDEGWRTLLQCTATVLGSAAIATVMALFDAVRSGKDPSHIVEEQKDEFFLKHGYYQYR